VVRERSVPMEQYWGGSSVGKGDQFFKWGEKKKRGEGKKGVIYAGEEEKKRISRREGGEKKE